MKRFITAQLPLAKLLPSDTEGVKTWEKRSKAIKNIKERKKNTKYICIFIKSIVLGFATKGHGLEFHSLSCTTVLTNESL